MIDYRKSGNELRIAWFEYRKQNFGSTISASSFAAGWNAAKGTEKEVDEDAAL